MVIERKAITTFQIYEYTLDKCVILDNKRVVLPDKCVGFIYMTQAANMAKRIFGDEIGIFDLKILKLFYKQINIMRGGFIAAKIWV